MQNIGNTGEFTPLGSEPPTVNRQWQLQANRQRELQATREYKDRLFKAIFGRDSEQSKRWRLDLYNALNDTDYTDPDALKLTTIENIIYITMKNDISFLIGSQMNLFEQQSTFNPNMPLRGLMYFAQLYQKNLSERDEDLFGTRLVKIPAPCFIVFYNGGDKKLPDVTEQKLSDAFEPAGSTPGFEWTAKVINIGGNHNETLQKKCKSLYDYCSYVNHVKQNLKSMTKEEAVEEALDYAIHENLLDGYFKRQKMEVLNMSLTEFDQEQYDRNRRREGYLDGEEAGFQRGERSGKEEDARNALALGLPISQISQITGLSVGDIQALAVAPVEAPGAPVEA